MTNIYSITPRDDATEKIESYIIDNNLKPHTRIPSEREMCKMWDCNRSTLRSAIKRLIAEGKLYSVMGSGTFVAEPKLVRNLQDLVPVSDLAREMGKTFSGKVISKQIIESTKQLSQKLHLPIGHKIFELIRLRLLDDIPVTVETIYVDAQRFKGLTKYNFDELSFYEILSQEYNVEIQKGWEKIGITYATEFEAELLNIEVASPLFFLSGVASDAEDNPIEYSKSVVKSEEIRFASQLTR